MKRFLPLALLLLIILVSCQPAPTPTPTHEPTPTLAATATPTDTATPLPYPVTTITPPATGTATPTADAYPPPETTTSTPPSFAAAQRTYYYPYFATQAIRPKLGLAAGGIQEWPNTPALLGLDWGAPSHQWGPYAVGPEDFYGLHRYPMLWGVTAGELATASRTLADYQGVVLGMNECDLPDQCGRSFCIFRAESGLWDCSQAPKISAVAMIAAMTALPKTTWVTPSFSDADRFCVSLSAWWAEFRAAGGDESRVIGMGYHRYTDGTGSFSDVLDTCYETLAANGSPLLPVWVTEAGLWWACNDIGAARFGRWLAGALNDERVVNVMIYAPRASAPFCPLVNGDGLTAYGEAVKAAGRPVTVNGYP